MADPREGLDRDGTIRTGASVHHISGRFRAVIDATDAAIRAVAPDASTYAYGSTTTGRASSPESDVDLLAVGVDADTASNIAATQSAVFRDECRAVEIATAAPSDLVGASDEAYGWRVFLHHYCVHLSGADLDRATSPFPGDGRAARGLNGDIDRHLARWWRDADNGEPVELGRRLARKTLLAVAGLVSVQDATWTTDRRRAARRWSDIHPELEAALDELLAWASGRSVADRSGVQRALGGGVATIVHQFAEEIGLWRSDAR
jgi:hypothetical protein